MSLKIKPEENVLEYFRSKQNVVHKNIWPVLVDPDIYLENCRGKLVNAERLLKRKRELYRHKRGHMDEQWNEVKAIGQSLKKNFSHFNSFLLTNMEKRKRTTTQIEEFRKLRSEKEELVNVLREKVDSLLESKTELDAAIAKYRIYETYLNDVFDLAAKDEHLKNVDDIIRRYEHYNELATDFGERQARDFQTLQQAKNDLGRFIEKNTKHIQGMYVHMVDLSSRLDKARARTHNLEILVSRIKATFKNKYLDASMARSGVYNLYTMMCRKKKRRPTIPKADFEGQLVFVGKTLMQYRKLNAQIKRAARASMGKLKGVKRLRK